jgi:hypothetical protein
MPVTSNRKDSEKLAFTGWRLVELLPTKTDLSADDTKLSQVRAAVGGYPSPDAFFLEAKYTKARPDQKHDNTIHDLTNRVRVRCGNCMVD